MQEYRGQKRIGKETGIRFQVLFGFVLYAAVIIILLWVMQILLLNPLYEHTKTTEVKNAAKHLAAHIDDKDLSEIVQNMVIETGITVAIIDESGGIQAVTPRRLEQPVFSRYMRSELKQIFAAAIEQNGEYISKVENVGQFYDTSDENSIIIYGYMVQAEQNTPYLLWLEAAITPVNATVDTLKLQLAFITVVLILLGAVFATIIAAKISRPIVSISRSAKSLGMGDYETTFLEEGNKETKELARTLNFAAGELKKTESLRKELIANVSHDLRTPLTMIKGYAEVMRDIPGENTPDNVQVIIDESSHLADLVSDLLDISKMESGTVVLEKSRFNLTREIESILKRYDKLADFRFNFTYDEIAYVSADQMKIDQVMYNLINNAIHYSTERKEISIRQVVQQKKVRIEVQDYGAGIEADKLQDIWDRYYKIDKTHQRAQIGTGLGLSIVKKVLNMHGGAYGVESSIGKGSTFWFELRMNDDHMES